MSAPNRLGLPNDGKDAACVSHRSATGTFAWRLTRAAARFAFGHWPSAFPWHSGLLPGRKTKDRPISIGPPKSS